jgi:hypothetical protein
MTKNIKTLLLVSVLVIIGIIAYFSTNNSNGVSSNGPLRNFSIADTAAISRFIISDTEGNKITISRENPEKTWMIDGTEFKAKPENATLILDALKRIVIRQDLDEAAINTSLNYLAVRHKKVEYFINKESTPVKSWYMGSTTVDHQGTHMLLQEKQQKSSIPFVVHKPGMRGSLDARFFTSFNDWRYTGIYNYKIGTIRNIQFINHDEAFESFSITVDKDSKINFLDEKQTPISVFDTLQLTHYVTHFKKLHFSHTVSDLTEVQIDSVLNAQPNATIEVTDDTKSKKKVNIWKIIDNVETDEGIIKKLNPGYAFLSINGSKELVRIQYHQWDNVLKPKRYFLPKKTN